MSVFCCIHTCACIKHTLYKAGDELGHVLMEFTSAIKRMSTLKPFVPLSSGKWIVNVI